MVVDARFTGVRCYKESIERFRLIGETFVRSDGKLNILHSNIFLVHITTTLHQLLF